MVVDFLTFKYFGQIMSPEALAPAMQTVIDDLHKGNLNSMTTEEAGQLARARASAMRPAWGRG